MKEKEEEEEEEEKKEKKVYSEITENEGNEGEIIKTIGIRRDLVGPRIKKSKENKIEDKLLQIACEDKEERKERLREEKKERQRKKQQKKEEELKNKNLIYKIDENNYYCVDCGKEKTTFLSINNGVTLCSICAQEHLLLGHSISYIKDINDKLDEYLFNFIVFGSNTRFKRFIQNEKVEQDLTIENKYKTKALYYYRKLLKNKIEGLQLPEKEYENPNEIVKENENDDFPEFNKYTIKKQIIIKGELKRESKLKNILNKIMTLGIRKDKRNNTISILRRGSSIKDVLKKGEVNSIENEVNDKVNDKLNVTKRRQPSITFDNDKLKESSRPMNVDKDENEKTDGNEETSPASKENSGNNGKR